MSTPIKRDKPWLMRTYSGHSSAKASNELYCTNLSKGQTGLSVAFDLPTQTGYDLTIRWRAAKSARLVCPSATSATWRRWK
ncbi:MAG: methylmalonyl-CoA mutase family protein [Candidatus Competibacteraceae bacterium]